MDGLLIAVIGSTTCLWRSFPWLFVLWKYSFMSGGVIGCELTNVAFSSRDSVGRFFCCST